MPTIIMLVVSTFFATPQDKCQRVNEHMWKCDRQVEMPDTHACMQTAEDYINAYGSSDDAKGAIAITAMCGKQFGDKPKEHDL